jgi:hypothetical protein
MPVFMMFLVAVTPILTMVVTSGGALGQHASLVALIALFGTLATLAAWLAGYGVRTVAGIWRRKMSGPYSWRLNRALAPRASLRVRELHRIQNARSSMNRNT